MSRAKRGSEEHLVSIVEDDEKVTIPSGEPQSRTIRRNLPEYPPPLLMTIHQAANYFSVNENMLLNVVIQAGIPILSTDPWGQPMYSREAIRVQLGR